MSKSTLLDPYMTPAEVAAELGVAPRTLDRWHRLGEGPARTLIGRRLFYKRSTVAEWIAAREEAA